MNVAKSHINWHKFTSSLFSNSFKPSASLQQYRKNQLQGIQKIESIIGMYSTKNIDFSSFTEKEIDLYGMMLTSYITGEECLSPKEIRLNNHGNYFYETNRVEYAVNRLLHSENKQYDFDDFI